MKDLASHYQNYRSSLYPGLELWARFTPRPEPTPLLLQMHGWHGEVKTGHADNLAPPPDAPCFRVQPEMRGRGDAGGQPDANGFELQDAVDALATAAALWPEAVDHTTGPHLHGGSGGGGNVLALLGKFPDLFASAVAECGISDYAVWYQGDRTGEFRDEMRDAGWIGGDPTTNTEAYLARGGRTTARNLLTPLLLVHSACDLRVPVEQSLLYLEAARQAGKEKLVRSLILPGVGGTGHLQGITPAQERERQDLVARHRQTHPTPPRLPAAGTMVIAGFLDTKRFRVDLESVGQLALLDYDLDAGRFALQAPSCRNARILLADTGRELSIPCRRLGLADFLREIIPGGWQLPASDAVLPTGG
jgi:hypothetical protein